MSLKQKQKQEKKMKQNSAERHNSEHNSPLDNFNIALDQTENH